MSLPKKTLYEMSLYKKITKPGIGFCYLLETEKTIFHYQKRICRYFHTNKLTFPAPQPVSIERKDLNKLVDYVCCHKLDGERFMLWTIKDSETNDNLSFLIDRNFKFYKVFQKFSDSSYEKESLFDGELIDDVFVIHDAFVVEGINLMQKDFIARYKTCHSFIDKNWKPIPIKSFSICLKKFYPIKEIKNLFDETNYKCDGVVFYPIKESVGCRTQFSLLKWKEHHTVDFKIRHCDDKEKTELLTWDNGSMVVYETIDSIKDSFPNDSIVEFEFMDGKFKPLKQRVDKSHGNSLFTIKKTMLNIRENITKKELIDRFSV